MDKNVFPLGKMALPSNKARADRSPITAAPALAPTRAAEAFVEGSRTHSVPVPSGPSPDWRNLDPKERATRGVNVRFNDYELGLLHHLARASDRSLQYTIKQLLMAAARDTFDEWDRSGSTP